MINSQISAKDKAGLGYDGQMNESELNNIHMNKSELVHSVFNSRKSDVDDSLVNDRFKIGEGFHAVPPSYTGNYMPLRPDLSFAGLDEYVFRKPKTVRPSAPIIEEWDTDSDNDSVFRPKSDQTTSKFTKINFVKSVATKSGQVPVNAAKQSSPRAATSISTVRPVNTVAPKSKVNHYPQHILILKNIHQVNNVTTAGPKAVVSAAVGNGKNAVKSSACWIWRPTRNVIDHNSKDSGLYMLKIFDYGNPQYTLHDQGIFDSGCSRHMTGNKSFLTDYQEINGGFVAFAGSAKGGKITGKGKIRTEKLDFEDVYFVKELKFNLFSVLQMCDKKNSVLFTDTECVVLSPEFKLLDESQVLLKVSRNNNMYRYSNNSKAFRVFTTRTRSVEENLNINFLENKPNVAGTGPNWIFDVDTLTMSMNYQPVFVGNQTNGNAEDEVADDAGKKNGVLDPAKEDDKSGQGEATNTNSTNRLNTVSSSYTTMDPWREKTQRNEFESMFGQDKDANGNGIYRMCTPVNAVGSSCDNLGGSIPVNAATLPNAGLPTDPLMPDLEDTANLLNIGIFSGAYDDEDVVQRIEAIRLFLAYASFMGFIVYQMDVKSAFLYGTIEEEVAWYETLSTYLLENRFRRGTIDKTLFIKKDKGDILLVQVYVDDIIFGSTKKSLCTEFESLMHKKFQMSSMGELTFFLGLQVMQRDDGIFISQDKYVADILKKFDFSSVKTASTPIETNKALLKDEEAEDVDVHLYRSMIGSLMYLTASRPDIMFAVCACARFQVTPKVSHLHAVKRIFRYLKGQPKLGLWYPRDSPFDLEAFSDSDYAGASLDRKSTTGGQVLWIQNQMLDYGFNFMNTKIYIDNESTICIVKNPVFHSKTKHIEIRHHFIRDSYEKRLIQVIKIHTDHNVADLLTKAFDVGRVQYLTASIGMLNL
ncbi:putative ribonuclease H-like domain-containing protein [Tanacetum coccineum]